MKRLNYFNPYKSKSENYEDQLTRAYLVLLRYSFHAFSIFFDYCRSQQTLDIENDEEPLMLNTLLEEGWEIDTQKANPKIETVSFTIRTNYG